MIFLGEVLFRKIMGYSSMWAAIPAIFVIALIFQPLRDRIQKFIDKIFFKGEYNYRHTLKSLSQSLGSIVELNQLLGFVTGNVSDTLKTEKVSIYLRRKDKQNFELQNPLETN